MFKPSGSFLTSKYFTAIIIIAVIVVGAVSIFSYIKADQDYEDCVKKCKSEYNEDISMEVDTRRVILKGCLDNCTLERDRKKRINDNNYRGNKI